MFPSSKKKRLWRVNRLNPVDRGTLVSADSTGELNGSEDIMAPLDKSEGVVMGVDTDGDSGLVIGVVWECWAMSRPGSEYGHILPAPPMEGLLVNDLHEQDQRLYDRLRTAHEHRFPAMSVESSSRQTHCGHAHRSTTAGKAADRNTGIVTRYRPSLSIHDSCGELLC